jgi:AraC-like DNA-binding protein
VSESPAARDDKKRGLFYAPGERQPIHRHFEVRIIVITKGAFREEGFGVASVFSRGDVIVRPAMIAHADFAGDAGASYLQFKAPQAILKRRAWRHGWAAARGRIDLDNKNVRKAMQNEFAADFLVERAERPAYTAPESGSLLDAAACRLSAGTETEIAAIAHRLKIRPCEFSRRFKRAFGTSPKAYANGARLERSLRMLACGEGSAAEIASACGFYDQSHLCRAVRRELAMTPGEFHRLVRR